MAFLQPDVLVDRLMLAINQIANTRWFNDGEMSGPIGPFNNPGGKTGADLRYGRHW